MEPLCKHILHLSIIEAFYFQNLKLVSKTINIKQYQRKGISSSNIFLLRLIFGKLSIWYIKNWNYLRTSQSRNWWRIEKSLKDEICSFGLVESKFNILLIKLKHPVSSETMNTFCISFINITPINNPARCYYHLTRRTGSIRSRS